MWVADLYAASQSSMVAFEFVIGAALIITDTALVRSSGALLNPVSPYVTYQLPRCQHEAAVAGLLGSV